MREPSAKAMAVFQLIIGLLYGGAVLWVKDKYGWNSLPMNWMALGLLFLCLAFGFTEIRSRISRLEKRGSERQ